MAMTADALNTITNPTKTRTKVTINNQRSTLMRFAMKNSFHHGDTRRRENLVVASSEKD